MDEAREDPHHPMPRPADDFVPLLESNGPVMQRLLEKAKRAAASDATILLTGESGTGKDVLAHQIHRWSLRAECPFVTVNCTTHSEHLLESELFGHMRGAFDGAINDKPGLLEAAHGGSIFLDEIADLTAPVCGELLILGKSVIRHTQGEMASSRKAKVPAPLWSTQPHSRDTGIQG